MYNTFRLFVDHEKEEQWLNQMAAKGYNLNSFCMGLYTFNLGIPNEYIYRIELLDSLPFTTSSTRYIEFMNEMGVELITSHFRWVYLRKRASDSPFDIYSDIDSKIIHYSRIIKLYGIVALSNFSISMANFSIWLTESSSNRFWLPALNFFVFLALGYTSVNYMRKAKKLKRERNLRE